MDFSAWSSSHTIFVAIFVLGFLGQIVLNFYRTGQLKKRLDEKYSQMDERFEALRYEIRDLRVEVGKLNQNHIDRLNRHGRGYESYHEER